MEARDGSSERDASGRRAGEVTLADLVRHALRKNLRRIIVGEVRGPEVLPMLDAMSTGDGSLCTVHARSAAQAIDRLVTLAMSAGVGITDTFAYRLLSGAVDLLVHIQLLDETALGGRRHRFVSEVLEVNGIGEHSRPALTTRVRAGTGRPCRPDAPARLPARPGPGRLRPGVPGRPGRHLDVTPACPGHLRPSPGLHRAVGAATAPQPDCVATTEGNPCGEVTSDDQRAGGARGRRGRVRAAAGRARRATHRAGARTVAARRARPPAAFRGSEREPPFGVGGVAVADRARLRG